MQTSHTVMEPITPPREPQDRLVYPQKFQSFASLLSKVKSGQENGVKSPKAVPTAVYHNTKRGVPQKTRSASTGTRVSSLSALAGRPMPCLDTLQTEPTNWKDSTTNWRRVLGPAVLTAWLELHSDHPFPSAVEKRQLAQNAGFSIARVEKWLIGARRRLKVPETPPVREETPSCTEPKEAVAAAPSVEPPNEPVKNVQDAPKMLVTLKISLPALAPDRKLEDVWLEAELEVTEMEKKHQHAHGAAALEGAKKRRNDLWQQVLRAWKIKPTSKRARSAARRAKRKTDPVVTTPQKKRRLDPEPMYKPMDEPMMDEPEPAVDLIELPSPTASPSKPQSQSQSPSPSPSKSSSALFEHIKEESMAILREAYAQNPHLGTMEEWRLAHKTGLNRVQVSKWMKAFRIDAGFGFKRISPDRARVLREYIHQNVDDPWPSKDTMMELSIAVNVTCDKLDKWFDETRKKLRRDEQGANQAGLCPCCWGPRYARA